jgi:hypothetical protein
VTLFRVAKTFDEYVHYPESYIDSNDRCHAGCRNTPSLNISRLVRVN